MNTPQATDPPPDAGPHPDVSSEVYFAWNAISKSRLTEAVIQWHPFRFSMARLKHFMDHGFPRRKGYVVGGALDCIVYEPHEFEHRYWMAKSCQAVQKSNGKVCGNNTDKGGVAVNEDTGEIEWRCGKHGGSEESIPAEVDPITYGDMAMVRAMKRSLQQDRRAWRLLTEGQTQLAIVGTCPFTGLPIKSRLDTLRKWDEGSNVVDLKKTAKRTPEGFMADIIPYGYHIQAYLYRYLADADFVTWVVVPEAAEYGEHHPAWIIRCDDALIRLGERHYRALVEAYHQCLITDTWPPCDYGVLEASTPRYMETDDE